VNSPQVRLAAGDTVTPQVTQNSGGALDLAAGARFALARVR